MRPTEYAYFCSFDIDLNDIDLVNVHTSQHVIERLLRKHSRNVGELSAERSHTKSIVRCPIKSDELSICCARHAGYSLDPLAAVSVQVFL